MSIDQVVLRVCVLVAPLVAVAAAFAAAGHVVWAVGVLVLFAAAVCAMQPDSNIGFFVIVLLAWHWAATVDDRRTVWLLVAAVALCIFHTAMAATTIAPSSARWSPSMRARWWRRLATVIAVTIAAWCVELIVAGTHAAGNAVLLLVALVLIVVAAMVLRTDAVAEG